MERLKHIALTVLAALVCVSCRIGYVDNRYNGLHSYSVHNIAREMAWNLAAASVLAIEGIDRSKVDIFARNFSRMVTLSNGTVVNVRKLPDVENCWEVRTLTSPYDVEATVQVSMKTSTVDGRNDWTCRGRCVYTESDGYSAEMNMETCECVWCETLADSAGAYVYKQTLLTTGTSEFQTFQGPEVLERGIVSFSKLDVSKQDSFSLKITFLK